MAGLPQVHEDEHPIYVYAGVQLGVTLPDQSIENLLWIREQVLRSRQSFGKLVMHGRTPTREDQPEMKGNRVRGDTGAYTSGVLTAAVFDQCVVGTLIFLSGDEIWKKVPLHLRRRRRTLWFFRKVSSWLKLTHRQNAVESRLVCAFCEFKRANYDMRNRVDSLQSIGCSSASTLGGSK